MNRTLKKVISVILSVAMVLGIVLSPLGTFFNIGKDKAKAAITDYEIINQGFTNGGGANTGIYFYAKADGTIIRRVWCINSTKSEPNKLDRVEKITPNGSGMSKTKYELMLKILYYGWCGYDNRIAQYGGTSDEANAAVNNDIMHWALVKANLGKGSKTGIENKFYSFIESAPMPNDKPKFRLIQSSTPIATSGGSEPIYLNTSYSGGYNYTSTLIYAPENELNKGKINMNEVNYGKASADKVTLILNGVNKGTSGEYTLNKNDKIQFRVNVGASLPPSMVYIRGSYAYSAEFYRPVDDNQQTVAGGISRRSESMLLQIPHTPKVKVRIDKNFAADDWAFGNAFGYKADAIYDIYNSSNETMGSFVCRNDGVSVTVYSKGRGQGTVISTDGYIVLDAGTYYIKESKAPSYAELSPKRFYFNLSPYGGSNSATTATTGNKPKVSINMLYKPTSSSTTYINSYNTNEDSVYRLIETYSDATGLCITIDPYNGTTKKTNDDTALTDDLKYSTFSINKDKPNGSEYSVEGAEYKVYWSDSTPNISITSSTENNGDIEIETNGITMGSGTYYLGTFVIDSNGRGKVTETGVITFQNTQKYNISVSTDKYTLNKLPAKGQLAVVETKAPSNGRYHINSTINKYPIGTTSTGKFTVDKSDDLIEKIVLDDNDELINREYLTAYTSLKKIPEFDIQEGYSMKGAEFTIAAVDTYTYAQKLAWYYNSSNINVQYPDKTNAEKHQILLDAINSAINPNAIIGKFTIDEDNIGVPTLFKSSLENGKMKFEADLVNNRIVRTWEKGYIAGYYFILYETKLPDSGDYEWNNLLKMAAPLKLGTTDLSFKEREKLDPFEIKIEKVSNGLINKTAKSTEGTVFEIDYFEGEYSDYNDLYNWDDSDEGNEFKGYKIEPARKWYMVSHKDDAIDSDNPSSSWAKFDNDHRLTAEDIEYLNEKGITDISPYCEDSLGQIGIPKGTIIIREIIAAEDYVLDGMSWAFEPNLNSYTVTNKPVVVVINDDYSEKAIMGGTSILQAQNHLLSSKMQNTPKSVSVLFNKYDLETEQPIDGISFLLRGYTDETRTQSLISAETSSQNGGMVAWSKLTEGYYTIEEKNYTNDYQHISGILKEFKVEKNGDEYSVKLLTGTEWIEMVPYEINTDGASFWLKDLTNGGNKAYKFDDVYNAPFPQLSTVETDIDTSFHITPVSNEAVIQDTVNWKYLELGKEWTIKGILMEVKNDGSTIPLKDSNGNYVLSHTSFVSKQMKEVVVVEDDPATEEDETVKEMQETTDYVVSPFEAVGTANLEFRFDASKLDGKTFVVYEYLFEGKDETDLTVTNNTVNLSNVFRNKKGTLIGHYDSTDAAQTGYIPKISTIAQEKISSTKLVYAGEDSVILDKVYIDNVQYEANGEKINFSLVADLYDLTKNEIIASAYKNNINFDKRNDIEYQMEIPFDARGYEGDTLVVLEYLFLTPLISIEGDDEQHKDTEITRDTFIDKNTGIMLVKPLASHAVKTDLNQTVYVPEIGTTAQDKTSETKLVLAKGNAIVSDIVAISNIDYSNDIQYFLYGELIDVTDNNKVLTTKYSEAFTGASLVENSSKTMDFTVDASTLKNHTLVVYEYLYLYKGGTVNKTNGTLIAIHEDNTDVGQTVYVPEIKTQVANVKSADGGRIQVTDTVTYNNLLKGHDYTLVADLYDTDGNLVSHPTEVTNFTIGTTGSVNGTQDVTFTFSLDGVNVEELVVYEYLYIGKFTARTSLLSSKLVAQHTDKSDPKQTFPLGFSVKFEKRDENTGEIIGGCVLEIQKVDGTFVETWTSETGKTHETRLTIGDYILVEKKAPENYSVTQPIPFTVALGGKLLVNGKEVESGILTISDPIITGLPTAGGKGIYGMVILGLVLIALPVYSIIRKKRRIPQ